MGGSHLWISTPGSNMWLHSFHAKIHAVAEKFALLFHTVWPEMKANFLHWILLALAGSGLLWLALACFGWLWLAPVASGWIWLAPGWLWLALVGSPKALGKTFPDQLILIIFYELLISLQF